MRITMRPYAGEVDKQRMSALVHAFPADNLHAVDLPYRLSSWALDIPENIGFWEDGAGRLLAWAVLQTPFSTFDYAYHPEARDYGIHPQILTWAIARAQAIRATPGRPPAWFVAVRADQTDRIGDLERAGFASQEQVPENPWSQVYMVRAAEEPIPGAPLPPGFTIRPLAGATEVPSYVELHRAAFGTLNMTAHWRARTLLAPEYIPDLDLVVVAPDGRLVAFCVCWFAPQGPDGQPTGQVEPMGVHPDFQRHGLGRTVLREGLRRLVAHGATQLIVQTDDYRDAARALYESVGFRVAHKILLYRKDFTNPH
jgi:mycothiol synthase